MTLPSAATLAAPGARDWAELLLLSLIWGAAFMGMTVALEGYAPLWVAAGRSAIGAAALLSVGLLTGNGPARVPGARGLRTLLLVGLFNIALPFTALTWGLQHVPSAFGGVAMGAAPLFVLLLSALFLPEERITLRRAAGFLAGLAGILLLVGPDALTGAAGRTEIAARIACVSATLFYGIGAILIRRAPPMPAVTLGGGMLAAAALMLVPAALALEGLPAIPADRATLALVFVGLFPTGLAFFLRIRLIRSAGPVFMSLVSYIVPLWAVAFGVLLLGESLRAEVFAALALIAAGIAVSQSGKRGGRPA